MATNRIPDPAFQELTIAMDTWQDWQIIALSGKFVVQSFSIVRNELEAMETGTTRNVAIDMSGITQIDSSALTIVLNFQRRLLEKGGKLVIFGPNAIIKDTLLIVGFNMAVPIYNTRAMFEQSVGHK
jgi:anti-anti-sigma factor